MLRFFEFTVLNSTDRSTGATARVSILIATESTEQSKDELWERHLQLLSRASLFCFVLLTHSLIATRSHCSLDVLNSNYSLVDSNEDREYRLVLSTLLVTTGSSICLEGDQRVMNDDCLMGIELLGKKVADQ